jgi:hypothetical protein
MHLAYIKNNITRINLLHRLGALNSIQNIDNQTTTELWPGLGWRQNDWDKIPGF